MLVKLQNRKFYIDLSLILNASLLKNDAKKNEDIIAFVKYGPICYPAYYHLCKFHRTEYSVTSEFLLLHFLYELQNLHIRR
jgi:hypothetical protein